MTHDNTAAVINKFEAIGAERIADASQLVFTLDHDIQNTSRENLDKYARIEAFAHRHGVRFFPAGRGIGHQIMVSHGFCRPGALVVASDSHSNMYGALGALGTPVVRTDAAAIWATGEFWWQIPHTVRVDLVGELREGVTGKDLIITLCGLYNSGEVLNAAVEFGGPGVGVLSMDQRLTIANMTTEWGALVGWFPVDHVTISYLRERLAIDAAIGLGLFSADDLEAWANHPPAPDPDARYAARIELDLRDVSPHVSGPDTVQVMRPLSEIEAERIPVDKAYLVSCVNSRLEDLEAAARVMHGSQVAEGVEMYVSAASQEVQEEAERTGVWGALVEAGARPLPPGCGPCIGLGIGLLEPGEVGISATNRNFKGRMGSREARAYLASPEVVAASAVAGYIAGPAPVPLREPAYVFEAASIEPAGKTVDVAILDAFPDLVRGRAVLVPADNLNTDGIFGKDYTYREGLSREEMAAVVMENYDPEFSLRITPGDILVGGRNFGTGSSREQAATALQAAGIAMVVAASFSQTYLRNAFNNGFVCIACPALVDRLRSDFGEDIAAGATTIIPESMLEIDFRRGVARYGGADFAFPSLGEVAQALIVAGGIENQVRDRLGITG
jgi:homoaconitate hydratase